LVILGFIFTAIVGLIASWAERKITARIQYRVGPVLLQPFYDIAKLFVKQTLIPEGSFKPVFLAAPIIGILSVIVSSTILWINCVNMKYTFWGDLIVVVYLFMVPSLSLMMGAFAAKNIYAALGAAREMKLILSYELPFILAILVPVIKSGYSVRFSEMLQYQAAYGPFAMSLSGGLAFIVAVVCIQAKLGFVPFDVAEAETEIVGGVLVEYSGKALGIFRLMKNMLLAALPVFLIMIFLGGLGDGFLGLFFGILKYIMILLLIVVIKNTNPRLRIDQAVRFFWGPVTVCAIAAVILAARGL